MLDLKLHPRQFAAAWLNVGLFASTDESRPTLCATKVEASTGGLALTTTDSYTTASTSVDVFGADEIHGASFSAPLGTYLVGDPDRRLAALCAFILKDTKGPALIAAPPVRLWLESAEHADVPTLMPELDRQRLVVTYRSEAVGVPVLDDVFPDVEALLAELAVDALASVALNPDIMARFAKVKDRDGAALDCVFNGSLKPIQWVMRCEPVLSGMWMPVRDGVAAVKPEGGDDADDPDESSLPLGERAVEAAGRFVDAMASVGGGSISSGGRTVTIPPKGGAS